MFKDHRHIDTYFINEEKTIVETMWADENDVVRTIEIEADDNDPQWQQLTEQLSIDDIHAATARNIREQDQAFRDVIMQIAKEDGLVYDEKSNATDVAVLLANSLFKYDDNKQKELLFQFKLQVFELDEVKNASSDVKSQIRKSETIIDVVKYVTELLV